MDSPTSLDKAIDVLEHLNDAGGARGITEIANALGVPKSSAHRLLKTLVRRGFAEQEASGRYRTGPALIALGLGARDRDPLVLLARPVLESEAAELGETVFLTAPRGREIVVVDKAEGLGFLRAAPTVGQRVPVAATAVGRLAMAFDPVRFPLAQHPPTAFTPATQLALGAVELEIERARRDGYAVNRGEWIEGLSVVAAPIFGAAEPPFAGAIAVAAPTPRLDGLGSLAIAQRAAAAARAISLRLAGRDPAWRRSPRSNGDTA
jgi:IclR family transcriptional regulator, acetate operon repressor